MLKPIITRQVKIKEKEANMTKGFEGKQDISTKYRMFFILLLFLPCLLIKRSLNSDIWFLLNSGRYVMEHGIPYMEPFTIHSGMEFIMQQWLSALIFWVSYSSFGVWGLNAVVTLCYLLTVYFFYKLCMQVSKNNFFISFVVSFFFNSTIQFFITQRPFIFSALLLVVELYVIERHLSDISNDKYIYILPVLSLLLINLQAAMWPMLLIVLVPYIINSFSFRIKTFQNQGYPKKHLMINVFLMIIIAFLNPYGIGSVTYLYNSYGYQEISKLVIEMLPPNINNIIGVMIYAVIFVVVSLYLIYRKGTTKIRYTLLTIGTAYMTLSSQRNFSFFLICGLFPLAFYFKDFSFPQTKQENTRKIFVLRKILIGLIVLALFVLGFKMAFSDKSINRDYELLNNAVDFVINENNGETVLYTGYNDGGLAEYKGLATYIDPRAEVFVKKNNKKEDIMKEYYLLQTGSLYYKDFVDKYRFTHLIVTEQDILFAYLKHDNDYKVVYSNEKYDLYKRINN